MTNKEIIDFHLYEFAQYVWLNDESRMVQAANLIWAKTGSKANFSKFYLKMRLLCSPNELAYDLPEHPDLHNGFKDKFNKIAKIEQYLGLTNKSYDKRKPIELH